MAASAIVRMPPLSKEPNGLRLAGEGAAIKKKEIKKERKKEKG